MTSNQYYGGLNRRFDQRSALLRRFGFKYQSLVAIPARTGGTMGIFVRDRLGRVQMLPAAEVMHAERRAWRDTLATTLQR